MIDQWSSKSPGPTAGLSDRSFTAKSDGAVVSRGIGIHTASRRWLSFLRCPRHTP